MRHSKLRPAAHPVMPFALPHRMSAAMNFHSSLECTSAQRAPDLQTSKRKNLQTHDVNGNGLINNLHGRSASDILGEAYVQEQHVRNGNGQPGPAFGPRRKCARSPALARRQGNKDCPCAATDGHRMIRNQYGMAASFWHERLAEKAVFSYMPPLMQPATQQGGIFRIRRV